MAKPTPDPKYNTVLLCDRQKAAQASGPVLRVVVPPYKPTVLQRVMRALKSW